MTVRIDRTVVSGTFSLDGGTWDVDNNVWVVGDDEVCVVVDAPHDARPILDLVAGRRVVAVLLTHGHDDHIGAALDLAAEADALTYLHPDDTMLWQRVHSEPPSAPLGDGDRFAVGDVELEVLHTPGHSPGSCCFYAERLGVVFTGIPSSRAGRARPAARSATPTPSSPRSGRDCSPCRRRPASSPATATRRRSTRRAPPCSSGRARHASGTTTGGRPSRRHAYAPATPAIV